MLIDIYHKHQIQLDTEQDPREVQMNADTPINSSINQPAASDQHDANQTGDQHDAAPTGDQHDAAPTGDRFDATPTVQTELGELIPLTSEFYQAPYNQLRRSKLMLFISCFMNYPAYKKLKYTEQLNFIQKIEKSCLNTALEKAEHENIKTSWRNDLFCEIYHQICSKLASNIDKNDIVNNPTFAHLILNHDIPLQQLPRLSSQEIYPQKYKDIMYKLELSKNIQQTTRTSSMYRCGKCHKNQTHIENLYNRSLDEGVNLSITCINCGHRWNA